MQLHNKFNVYVSLYFSLANITATCVLYGYKNNTHFFLA